MLAEPDSRVRANAVEGLWETRSALAAALFREAALDPDHRVAANALIGLHYCGDTDGVFTEVLATMLRNQNPLARAAAAFASGYIMDANSTSALETLLRDPDAGVRGQALRSLIRIRRQDRTEAVPAAAPESAPEAPSVAPIPEIPATEAVPSP
jgi:HEAT repeat protein